MLREVDCVLFPVWLIGSDKAGNVGVIDSVDGKKIEWINCFLLIFV